MYYLSSDIHLYNGVALAFLYAFQMTRALTPSIYHCWDWWFYCELFNSAM